MKHGESGILHEIESQIEIIRDEIEGGYVSHSFADKFDKGIKMLEDAKRQWLIAAMESGYYLN